MSWRPRAWIFIGLLLGILSTASIAQITTTQVADTVYHADGTPATGTVLISWPAFTTASGEAIATGSVSVAIATGGALSVNLTPNAGATPIGTYYTAVLHLDDGSVSREYWVVPVSSTPVKINTVETTVLPTTVAMQTVSKAYVDNAIAQAVTGHPMDASSPYVLKTGDTMSGPLNLPGDPTSPYQAADKNYVDESVASFSGGQGQSVVTHPAASQVVSQPSGTQLEVNNLNEVLYASQYATGSGANGTTNAAASPDCASGCQIHVEQSYTQALPYSTPTLNNGTHITDNRGGARTDSFLNTTSPQNAGSTMGEKIDAVSTISTTALAQQGTSTPASYGMLINHSGLAGGSNLLPGGYENPPYFKTGYSALQLQGTYNTQGQHGLMPEEIDCFGVGDCLLGSRFINASGGWRDAADEGAHLYDTTVTEDARVFRGGCVSGCTTGSTTLMLRQDAGGGTQGDGRFLIDTNSAKTITSQSTGGAIVSGFYGNPHASVTFTGTNFPVSTFLSTAQVIPSQAGNMAPGTVNVAIATSGVTAGYATNTAAIGSSNGVACIVDQNSSAGTNYEMVPYSVVDGTHLQMTFLKPHASAATLAFGGLCGYGIEQTVDTANGIRQLFPVVGSYSPTGLYYESLATAVLGAMNQTDGFVNTSVPVATLTRTGGVVSVILSGGLPYDLNGLNVTIAGAADSSFNGTFPITTTGANTFTYTQSGANSSTTGGTVSYLTGGFALYPMAEVLSVFDQATKSVDGQVTLAPNTVPWAINDGVEEPHFFQEYISADTESYGQTVPRPAIFNRAGHLYTGLNSGSMFGWSIGNATPSNQYFGYGGTHIVPTAAYESTGVWQHNMNLTAGEQAVFNISCNLHGCDNWNSGYDLFELQGSAGYDVMHYAPQTSNLSLTLRGSTFTFAPTGLTAGTINATTVNAGVINGSVNAANVTGTLPAATLPVFGGSGSSHAAGAVPDPGSSQGSARFLREDGIWVAPPAGSGGSGASGTASITGGSIDGAVIGASAPAAVNATTLNAVQVNEYTNTPRKPLTTLLQALHNAPNQPVNIVVLSDSFGVCDYTNCNTGTTVSSNRYTEQLRINLQAQYGSHGTGMVPLIAVVPNYINPEVWAVSGTWNTVNTLGPYQLANLSGSALVHLANGAVATFTSTVPYDTVNTYCMTSSSSGSIAVAIDGVAVGTACGSTTSNPTAHAVTSSARTLGTHVTTFTSTGDSYLYAAEGTAGTSGVSVHNLSTGSAAAEWFGLNPASQLAFSDQIPGGVHGVITMLQTNEPGVGYSVSSFTAAMNGIISHEQSLPSSPSVLMVVPPVDAVTGTAPYTAAQQSIAQTQNVGFVNIQDRWGTTFNSSSGLWDMGSNATGIHPNDKGARDMYSMIYAALIDPVPFGTGSSGPATNIAGLVAAGTGVSVTGSGSSTSPYIISSNGSGGGCTSNCTFTGTTTLNGGVTVTSSNSAGTYTCRTGTASGVRLWCDQTDSFGHLLFGDFTAGYYTFELGDNFLALNASGVYGWRSNAVTTDAGLPDTALSRTGPGALAVGNGTAGDTSGSLALSTVNAALYQGPASAPTGSCSTVGWAFSQDGHGSFCNGSSWAQKF